MRHLLLLCALLLLALPVAQAQSTFTVTVVASTDDHPNPNPWPEVYAIDGVQGATLTLERGQTYTFQMSNVPALHPFYISTSSSGGGVGVYSDGVTGNFATGNATLTFTVPEDAPDQLYYQCASHPNMGWQLNIVSGGTATEEPAVPAVLDLGEAYPNPFRERTSLQLTLHEAQDVTVEAFDVAGRRVAVLHRGLLPAGASHAIAFDAAGLPAGVYVVRATTGEATVERRVAIVR